VLKVAPKAVVVPELSFTVPAAENETAVPVEVEVRTNGEPRNAAQDPPMLRAAQFVLADPSPTLVNVNCACGSAGIARKFEMGRVPETFCNVAVLPPNPAKAPELVPRSTVFRPPTEKKSTLVWESERDVEPIPRMSCVAARTPVPETSNAAIPNQTASRARLKCMVALHAKVSRRQTTFDPRWSIAAARLLSSGVFAAMELKGTARAFRFLRQPSRPSAPRPLARSGSAAGNGVVAFGFSSDISFVIAFCLTLSPRRAEFALDLIINSTHVQLVATRDLVDRHAIKAVSIGRLVMINQAGLA
jgi:hypothetical protein